MLKVIIVDDEQAAREGLILLLAAHKDVEILGEAESVEEACRLIESKEPDVVLLDIEMPNVQGFSLQDYLTENTQIIFVTAHAKYAAKAFEVEALDYLLKPVRAARLTQALDRARCLSLSGGSRQATLLLRNHGKDTVVTLEEIIALEAEGNYTRFLLENQSSILVSHTIGTYHLDLPENRFLRLNRSLIVNLEKIDSLETINRERSVLQLDGLNEPIILRRAATQKLRLAMAKS